MNFTLFLTKARSTSKSIFKPTFRTLYCHNRFLRDFGNLISHFLYTEVGNRTGDRKSDFVKFPKFVV